MCRTAHFGDAPIASQSISFPIGISALANLLRKPCNTLPERRCPVTLRNEYLGNGINSPKARPNNVAERWNRTLEKGFVVRYGIPTLQSANVLMSALWFKELLLHGRKHGEKTNSIHSMSLPKICQEKLEIGNILHFFKDNGGSCLEKLG